MTAEVPEEQDFPALSEPLLTKTMVRQYPEILLRNGMKKEMEQMAQFQAYEAIHIDSIPMDKRNEIMDIVWVHKFKGDEIRSRLCVRGFHQNIESQGVVYACTPVLQTIKLMFSLSIIYGWEIRQGDVSVAFLHASFQECGPEELILRTNRLNRLDQI